MKFFEISTIIIHVKLNKIAILNKGKIVLVLGGIDTGKTYFTKELANYFVSHGKKVAIIDSDVGQAYIGPPTTIGLGILEKGISPEKEIPPAALYFVGSVSPVKYLLPTVVGTKLMVEKASVLGVDKVIVDTGGLIQGGLGRITKCSKIEIVSPDHLVVIQRKKEAEHIIESYEHANISIHRIKVSPHAKIRTPAQRAVYRAAKFKHFFKAAKLQELSLKRIDLSYKLGKPEKFNDILISLDDENGEVLSLGVIKEISFAKRHISFLSPLKESGKVKRIQSSQYRLEI